MNRLGDPRKPLVFTEMSWPTARGQSFVHFDWDTTPAGQARNIAAVLPMLAAQRRALGMDDGVKGALSDFAFAGLTHYKLGGQITDKPGLAAFKRAALRIERCRAKGSVATRCLKH
jgi:hypothetical protein